MTLDGTTGRVLRGKRKLLPPDPENLAKLDKFMSWAEPFRKIGVRANADIPRDAKKARELRRQGIGLCRTEHMFFAPDRIPHMRKCLAREEDVSRLPSGTQSRKRHASRFGELDPSAQAEVKAWARTRPPCCPRDCCPTKEETSRASSRRWTGCR